MQSLLWFRALLLVIIQGGFRNKGARWESNESARTPTHSPGGQESNSRHHPHAVTGLYSLKINWTNSKPSEGKKITQDGFQLCHCWSSQRKFIYQGEEATRITRPWILLEGSPVAFMSGTISPLDHLPSVLFGQACLTHQDPLPHSHQRPFCDLGSIVRFVLEVVLALQTRAKPINTPEC